MTDRARNLTALGMVVAAIALAVWLVRRASSEPLRAVPASSFLVLSIDFESLRASPLFKAAFGAEGARTLGFPSFAETCGFDPLDRAAEVHVAIPENGEPGDFGVVATGEVTADELIGCGKKLVAGSGPPPPMRDEGSFKMFADESSGLRIAFRRGGPAIGGRGKWVQTMIAAAEGREPSLGTNPLHEKMREQLGSASIVLTAVMPRPLRERLEKEWGAGETLNASLAGVLGVDTIALSLDAGSAARPAKLAVRLGCDGASACAEVKKLIERKRFEWGKDIGLRLVGVGSLLDALEIRASGSELELSASVPADELAGVVKRVLEMRKERRAAPVSSAAAPRMPLRVDDELRPHKDAGLE